MKRILRLALCSLLALGAGQGWGVQLSVNSPQGAVLPVQPGSRLSPPTAPAPALIAGVIHKVDAGRAEMEIGGQRLAWDPERLRVFDSLRRQALDATGLRPGQRVRFALDPAAAAGAGAAAARVQLIYVDAQP